MLQNELAARFMKTFEAVTGALKVVDNDHAYIHEGIMFNAFSKETALAEGGTIEFAFVTPATGYIHYRLAGIFPSADKVDTQIYRDAEFTGGTELETNNRNDNSNNLATAKIYVNPTFSVNGDLLPGFSSWLPGSTSVGQTRMGASGKSEDEIVLKQNTTYRFVATNGSVADNVIGVNFRWYEETEE